jgi:hypothetical protein
MQVNAMFKASIALGMVFLAIPGFSQTPLAPINDESKFIQLNPPPPYSYKEGSVKRYTENNRRYVGFEGTTLIPPYFRKDAEFVNKPIWVADPVLSMGRWAWDYVIDCDEQSFDRKNDQVGWRSVRWDPTATAAFALFCPLAKWETLTIR